MRRTNYQSERHVEQWDGWFDANDRHKYVAERENHEKQYRNNNNNNNNNGHEQGRKFHAVEIDRMPNPFMDPLRYRDLVKARQRGKNDQYGKNAIMTEQNKLGYGPYGGPHDIFHANKQDHNYRYGSNMAMIPGKNHSNAKEEEDSDENEDEDEEEEEHDSGFGRHDIWHANKQEHDSRYGRHDIWHANRQEHDSGYGRNDIRHSNKQEHDSGYGRNDIWHANKQEHDYGNVTKTYQIKDHNNNAMFNKKKQDHNRYNDSSEEEDESSDEELVENMKRMGVLEKTTTKKPVLW